MELPSDLVAELERLVSLGVITGAGVSAESGIQTYRGKGGLYDDEAEGDRTVQALSAPTLQTDPARTWQVVAELARRSIGAAPNPAHVAIAEMERHVASFVLLTQNVDGLHRLAGSREVIDIHGDVLDALCTRCQAVARFTPDAIRALEGVPSCASCGSWLRPHVVLFGEMLPTSKVERLYARLIEQPPDLILIAGTTAVFPYIAEPVLQAARRGLPTVEVNPEPTAVTPHVRWSLRGKAGEVLPEIARVLSARRAPDA